MFNNFVTCVCRKLCHLQLSTVKERVEKCSCGPESIENAKRLEQLEEAEVKWKAERLSLKKQLLALQQKVNTLEMAAETSDRTASLWG